MQEKALAHFFEGKSSKAQFLALSDAMIRATARAIAAMHPSEPSERLGLERPTEGRKR